MSFAEVARLAGVSSTTVSRVMNRRRGVSAETVANVLSRLREMRRDSRRRVRPGTEPRPFSGAATVRIGVFAGPTPAWPCSPGFAMLMGGVADAAREGGAEIVVCGLPADPGELPSQLHDLRIDGVLLGGEQTAIAGPFLQGTPAVVLMGNRQWPAYGDQVMPDALAVGELAAEHLLAAGHRHLAFLNLDGRHWSKQLYGYAFARTCHLAGASVVALTEDLGETAPSMPRAELAVRRLLSLSPRPTGVFVAEDAQTALVQPAFQRLGVIVGARSTGGEIELVSCNNESSHLLGLSPRPVTVDIRLNEIGRRGVHQLAERIAERSVRGGDGDRVVSLVRPWLVDSNGAAVGTGAGDGRGSR